MFDQTPSAAWTAEARLGDIAMCDLPLADRPDAAPARRPWLLIDLEIRLGRQCAVLAPLHDARPVAERGYEVAVALPRDLRAAGLRRRTVFGCRRPRVVPLDALFGVRLGRLEGDRLERLHAVRARRHAERDIRAEQLRELREERRERLAPPRRPTLAVPPSFGAP